MTGTIMLKMVVLFFALIGVVPAAFADPPAKTIRPEKPRPIKASWSR